MTKSSMQLTDQVTNLELSRRLKELGVKQDSMHWWVKDFEDNKGFSLYSEGEICGYLDDHYGFYPAHVDQEKYAAFTASELGEMLPVGLQIKKFEDRWICELTVGNLNHIKIGDTLVGAMSKMLVYLIEKGLVKV